MHLFSCSTSVDMAELPLGAVQILGDELLGRPLLAVILRGQTKKVSVNRLKT
jgi:hypothetical protein